MKRRPLLKSRVRMIRTGPDECVVDVEGTRIRYAPLFAEWWLPLLDHAPTDVLKLREFLLCGDDVDRHDWDDGADQPVYWVGHPDDTDRVRCVGPAAAMAALRRWFPFRDYQREADEHECDDRLAVESAQKVVELRPRPGEFPPPTPSAVEIRQRLRSADPDWTPGRPG